MKGNLRSSTHLRLSGFSRSGFSRSAIPTIFERSRASDSGNMNVRGESNSHIRGSQSAAFITNRKSARQSGIILAATGIIPGTALFHSWVMGLVFALAGGGLPFIFEKRKLERERIELAALWPEIIDHIISGLRSGMSLAETLIGLSQRGPISTRNTFKECELVLRESGDFNKVFSIIKERFHDGLADQVCEVLNFARGTGSRDTAITLRTLGDFIRSDIALRSEIRSKHGWIKNSALIAAAAPWILLLILSTQSNTIKAFSTASGVTVLFVGVGMSVVAYLWMGRAGKLPEVPRIFQ